MKVSWYESEWYPVLTIAKYDPKWDDNSIEITEAEYEDYVRVMKEFDAWQDKIEKLSLTPKPE